MTHQQIKEATKEFYKNGGKVTKLEPSHDEVQVAGDFSSGFLVPRDDKFMPVPNVNSPYLLGDMIYSGGIR